MRRSPPPRCCRGAASRRARPRPSPRRPTASRTAASRSARPTAKYVAKAADGSYRDDRGQRRRGRAVPDAGDRARPLPALRQGEGLPRRRARRRVRGAAAPDGTADWRVTGDAGAFQLSAARTRPTPSSRRTATGSSRARGTGPTSPSSRPQGCARLPRGRDQRHRRAALEPDAVGRGPRDRRRPHAHDGLRVPRRQRALRPAVAPVRRRRTRWSTAPTTSPASRRSRRRSRARSATTPSAGRRSRTGPTTGSLTHESSYYKWVERAWLGGLRVFANLLVDNARPLRALSAQAQQLQRDGRRAAAGQAHARAAGLHRRAERRPGQGLVPRSSRTRSRRAR